MEVGPAKAKGADPGPARRPSGRHPVAELGVDRERAGRPVHVRVWLREVQARRQLAVVQREDGLEYAGGTGGGLEVADVGLDRPQGDRAVRRRTEDGAEALELGCVADPCGRAMRLAHRGGRRVRAGLDPGALHREPLPDRVGRGDALPLAVAGPADPEQHRVHAVAVALRVGEPLEHEDGRTLTHHEAVGAGVEGTRPGRGERADLAELDEGCHSHVPVDSAGHHSVDVARLERLRGGRHGRQSRRARGVRREVGAAQAQHRRDPAGDHVRELAGHGVLGDLEELRVEELARLVADSVAHRLREGLERRGVEQLSLELRVFDAQVRPVVLLAAERVAEDHADAVGIDVPAGPAGIEQRGARGRDRPLLPDIHLRRDLRRDGQPPSQRVPRELADPSPDTRVGLVQGLRVGVVVQRGVPALGRHVGDAVPALAKVPPEGLGIGGLRQDRCDPDDGDRLPGRLVHDGSFCRCATLVAVIRCGRRRDRPPGPCRQRARPARRAPRVFRAPSPAKWDRPPSRPHPSPSADPPRPRSWRHRARRRG